MKIGYIKKGSCTHIKKLISSDSIRSITATAKGGLYKIVNVEGVDENDRVIDSELEKGSAKIYIDLTIDLNN